MINLGIARPIERIAEVHRRLLEAAADGRADLGMVRDLAASLRECADSIEAWLDGLLARPVLGAMRRREGRRDVA